MAPATAPRLRRLQQEAVRALRAIGLSVHANRLESANDTAHIRATNHAARMVVFDCESVLMREGHESSEQFRRCERALEDLTAELRNEPRDDDRRTA